MVIKLWRTFTASPNQGSCFFAFLFWRPGHHALENRFLLINSSRILFFFSCCLRVESAQTLTALGIIYFMTEPQSFNSHCVAVSLKSCPQPLHFQMFKTVQKWTYQTSWWRAAVSLFQPLSYCRWWSGTLKRMKRFSLRSLLEPACVANKHIKRLMAFWTQSRLSCGNISVGWIEMYFLTQSSHTELDLL